LLLGTLAISEAARGDDQAQTQIANLIEKLGNNDFQEREKASKELESIGEPALPALRKAQKTSLDFEVRRRARGLAQRIE